MNEIKYPETEKFVIVQTSEENIICHRVGPNNCFTTPFPILAVFDSLEEAKASYPQGSFLEKPSFLKIQRNGQ